MQIGVIYPQTEFGSDPARVRDFAQTVEELGFSYVSAYEHVLGANPDRPGGWRGIYNYEHAFLEPFVLFSYMAAVTNRLGFMTRVVILPQRQTALVAKQAATLDVLSAGRLRLGVGIGWNEVEYVALGRDFSTRGRQVEEQVALLRRLWTEPLVTFDGRWHTIPDAGINPLPVQRPIPIWFGGHVDAVIRRVARIGDGWLPNFAVPDEGRSSLEKLDRYLEEAGRARSSVGLGPRLPYDLGPEAWGTVVEDWRTAGATHLDLNTLGCGFSTPDAHLQALRTFAETLDLGGMASEGLG